MRQTRIRAYYQTRNRQPNTRKHRKAFPEFRSEVKWLLIFSSYISTCPILLLTLPLSSSTTLIHAEQNIHHHPQAQSLSQAPPSQAETQSLDYPARKDSSGTDNGGISRDRNLDVVFAVDDARGGGGKGRRAFL